MVERLVALEKGGAGALELEQLRGRGRSRAGCVDGDLAEGILPCGAAAGLVTRVVSVAELMRELVEGYQAAKGRMP